MVSGTVDTPELQFHGRGPERLVDRDVSPLSVVLLYLNGIGVFKLKVADCNLTGLFVSTPINRDPRPLLERALFYIETVHSPEMMSIYQ